MKAQEKEAWDAVVADVTRRFPKIIQALARTPSDTPASAAKGEAVALIEIVEGIRGALNHGTWVDANGRRLKDTPEWAAFYVAQRQAQPHPSQQAEGWTGAKCPTCKGSGERNSDPMGSCPDCGGTGDEWGVLAPSQQAGTEGEEELAGSIARMKAMTAWWRSLDASRDVPQEYDPAQGKGCVFSIDLDRVLAALTSEAKG